MYKKFFMGIAAMAALTLVSCSSDDLNSLSDNSSKNEAISFDGYLGRSAVAVNGSRGSVLDNNTLPAKGFGVFGNYSSTETVTFGTNLFNNVKVTGETSTGGTTWTYDHKKYWPTEGHIDFLAYAPYAEKTLKNTTCIDFTVAKNAAEQEDLLWAKAEKQTKTNQSGGNKVKFTFNHALSRLGYSVNLKEAYSGATIKLQKITLAGSADEKTNAFYTKGTIDLSCPSSSTTAAAASLWTISSPDDKQNFPWFSGEQTLTKTDKVANNNSEYLFVIPQDFSKTTAGADELYVIVEYTISYSGVTETITNRVSSKLKKNFEQGKAYMINLTIGLTPIEFDADVTDWGVDDEINIDSWK